MAYCLIDKPNGYSTSPLQKEMELKLNTTDTNEFQLKIMKKSNVATIHLGGRFGFLSHHQFTSAYLNLLSDSIVNTLAVDLSNVKHLDSAALGMLLILRERIELSGKSLLLLRPSPIVASAFAITHFHRLFTIQLNCVE